MTTSFYFLLMALGLLLYVCQSSFGNQHTRNSDTPKYRCGSEIPNSYIDLCFRKRNDAGKKRGRASPLWQRGGSLSMLKARAKRNEAFHLQRAHRGVVEHCCHRPCSNAEFKKFCG
uniref:Con-Ins T1A n=1 Tax=Conus tulipa TaxID=6495 RepID=INS1A_CONTU|nr:RecName: Full=Con-Ins T1A; AltName: Full=Con-Ins T1; AltName: Full=Insulin 1; Contains: RecName: Full=Con-Ins T1A B chain; AltName: Full=Con-Ins T1 B chain; Contains: RecName: Full=Con-Ins T1A A chain; AltName: Full=Con-Ins T1 A chain; Flags: Precursor [Conus tulipa]AJD85833.1 insulin 1 precursor [Conus tulipa]